jgi:hypothetical protein
MRIILTAAERAEIEAALAALDAEPRWSAESERRAVDLFFRLAPWMRELPWTWDESRAPDLLRALLAHADVGHEHPRHADSELQYQTQNAPPGMWWCDTCRDYHNDGEYQGY